MDFVFPEEKINGFIPDELFIYMSMDNAVKALANKGVYLSCPSRFNDPFEELYPTNYTGREKYKTWLTFRRIEQFYLTNEDYIAKYWGSIDFKNIRKKLQKKQYDWVITVEEAVEDFIRISGFDKIPKTIVVSEILKPRLENRKNLQDDHLKIACFCGTCDSIPMWSYYGKNHTGCCIRFDLRLLSDENIKGNIFPILYCANRNGARVHFHKSEGWEHENEFRIIIRDCREDYLPFDCITGIYFGINNDLSDSLNERSVWWRAEDFEKKTFHQYDRLISFVKEANQHIELFKGKTSLDEYKIQFEKFY